MYRSARALLEERGVLTPRRKHENGAEWIFWAEVVDGHGGRVREADGSIKPGAQAPGSWNKKSR